MVATTAANLKKVKNISIRIFNIYDTQTVFKIPFYLVLLLAAWINFIL